ncbi:MAG: ParB/RepB/Spo0J family partition protein [Planctomycetota bacterium]|nr:ParB/RepB/Spo0J family partition protein [Planctomycetota bacterium]MDA1105375.1 ParB/RepB/Spo0J family partition protein [Planctomycetota bacterium]
MADPPRVEPKFPAGGSASTDERTVVAPGTNEDDRIVSITISEVRSNRLQPRASFSESTIAELARSIESSGLIQPIVVRKDRAGGYELIAGERRLRAAKHLNWRSIPALIRPITDEEAGYWSLIENIQREELNPMERAEGLERLRSTFGATQATLAQRLGIDRATVANLLRLTDLEPATAELVRAGKLTLGHAKVLLGLDDVGARASIASRAAREEWSVRQTEHEVKSIRGGGGGATVLDPSSGSRLPQPKNISAHIAQLERALGDHLGTRVSIRLGRKAGAGKLVIEFFSLDQFDGLTDRMGYRAQS